MHLPERAQRRARLARQPAPVQRAPQMLIRSSNSSRAQQVVDEGVLPR